MSTVVRAILVGSGLFILLVVWNVLQAVAQGDPAPFAGMAPIVLAVLGVGGWIVGWLWMIKIGRDAGKV